MLPAPPVGVRAEATSARRGRPLPSPKQRYEEYLLQRIEDYKNSIPREELLRLGNDAATELQDAPEGQYFLTEVLMQEMVDRLIIKRLKLPGFTKWRQNFAKRREAQREPTHWGIERSSALVAMLPRLEAGDHAIVVGSGAEPAAYLLAAHDLRVTCLFGDDPTCTRIENRMAAEALTGGFNAYVVMLGTWFPNVELPVHLVVIDAETLARLTAPRRLDLMARLQDVTAPGGVHAVLPHEGKAAETWVSLYPDWERLPVRAESSRRGTRRGSAPGILLSRPLPRDPVQASTA